MTAVGPAGPAGPTGYPGAPAASEPPKRPWLAMILSGVGLIVVAIVLVMVIVVMAISDVAEGLGDPNRDAVLLTPNYVQVPGEVSFRVLEPLAAEPDLRVGVGIEGGRSEVLSGRVQCTISRDRGDALPNDIADVDSFLDSPGHSPVWVAVVPPGEYIATCDWGPGGPFEPAQMFVGRVVGKEIVDGLSDDVGEFVLLTLAAFVCGAVGIGLIIAGAVRRSRSRPKPGMPPGGYAPPPGHPAPGHPAPPPGPGSGWSPPPSG